MRGNRHPNMSGIDRHWRRGEDARVLVAEAMRADPRDPRVRESVDSVVSALLDTVMSNRRVKVVGFGVFNWIKWRNRVPTGETVDTWRLTFKLARKLKGKYKGGKSNGRGAKER